MEDALAPQTVGETVRLLRARRGLEQIELAHACGWRDASAVSRIETDRIAPTRRTLVRLADNLAGERNAEPQKVRAWLFLAAGILPVSTEIETLHPEIPEIETWAQPAMIADFGWYVWRANDPFVAWVGLPAKYQTRNLLELLFDESVRATLGQDWLSTAHTLIALFRAETTRRTKQRWYAQLQARLARIPDFEPTRRALEPPARSKVAQRTNVSLRLGPATIITVRLTADPRLRLWQIVPDDPRTVAG